MQQELITLTDHNLDAVLNGMKPVLIVSSNGDGLRSEFSIAFKKAAADHPNMVFAQLDPVKNPRAAEVFGLGDRPVLVAWYCGEELARRQRPWGSDVPLAVEMLQKAYQTQNPEPIEEKEETVVNNQPVSIVDDKPIAVTDATFQTEVIDYDKPVLVDFWAEWCGPCRMVAPVLDKLAKEFAGQIRIAKVNVDENPGLSQTFRVMSIPNLMMIKQRTIVFNQPGALPEAALRDLIQQLIALEIPPQDQKQAANERP